MLQAFLIVLGFCVLALLPYLIASRIFSGYKSDNTKELAASILFRIGALHSLILALVFAQELLNFSEARHVTTHEAALVGNIYYDLRRYDEASTDQIQKNLIDYVDNVLHVEWESLAKDSILSEQAWTDWKDAYLGILDLEPDGIRQQALKAIMLDQVRELSELRINRETASLAGTNKLFFYAAIAGLVIMSIGYFSYTVTRMNLILLTLYGIYTGLVMYFIVAFSNPFTEPGQVEPVRLERLYDGMLESLK